jgi:hypothetical protein
MPAFAPERRPRLAIDIRRGQADITQQAIVKERQGSPVCDANAPRRQRSRETPYSGNAGRLRAPIRKRRGAAENLQQRR